MAARSPSSVLQHLRMTLVRESAEISDGEVLERYVLKRDPDAFAVLLRRHGPMVWGVCRRLLVHQQDAEDAFQATFLVLVRRAVSILPREQVSNWLYGVACKTAMKARAGSARRKQLERQVASMPEPEAVRAEPWCEL